MPTPPDDILLNKAAIIERCVRRLQEEARACPGLDNFTHVGRVRWPSGPLPFFATHAGGWSQPPLPKAVLRQFPRVHGRDIKLALRRVFV